MDLQGLDIQAGAKALVPNEFRPTSSKDSWGEPLLNGRQFLAVLAIFLASSISAWLLYYSFYLGFILSSVETAPSSEKATSKPIAGSYTKIIKHVISSYGWVHFVSGAGSFIWTSAAAFLGGWALKLWVIPKMPEILSASVYYDGTDVISSLALEPLNILFTHKVLIASSPSSMGILRQILGFKSQLVITLIYISTIRLVVSAIQATFMVNDATQHYSRPFATFTAYIMLLLVRIVLVTRAHVSLLPPTVSTTVEVERRRPNSLQNVIWDGIMRTLRMFKLLLTCVMLGIVHLCGSFALILYASGQSQRIIDWAFNSEKPAQGRATRDPGFMMGFDPERDPHHVH